MTAYKIIKTFYLESKLIILEHKLKSYDHKQLKWMKKRYQLLLRYLKKDISKEKFNEMLELYNNVIMGYTELRAHIQLDIHECKVKLKEE